MTNKYGLHGKLKATAGNGEKLAAILLKASQLVATAKGCHLYVVSRDKNEQEVVWVTEIWDSKEDHGNSLKVAGVRE
jgi:quinol monooxygenase YgiN